MGLSPRVRGIRQDNGRGRHATRSIPACTGNPLEFAASAAASRVYPRVYGESDAAAIAIASDAGLSPRVRGIRRGRDEAASGVGSIPACTGNPHHYLGDRTRALRSIPACTGNPKGDQAGRGTHQVYPRVYGESSASPSRPTAHRGLSPRVRGIPLRVAGPGAVAGSIPACTGNPRSRSSCSSARKVYPRVYGESDHYLALDGSHGGLSPRVRGIPTPPDRALSVMGSIPACTGNPQRHHLGRLLIGVYPRVYGESAALTLRGRADYGLSPRVRGIPRRSAGRRRLGGSIPACTGNPSTKRWSPPPRRVYPRVYGESFPLSCALFSR